MQENRHAEIRVNTNTDLFNFLLISSDPTITALRSQTKVPSTKLPSAAIELLHIEKSEANDRDESNGEEDETSSDSD
ncbi:Hypothetical protein CINCED_3A024263 [Cinara cedri]|uniref:Uncharacterized protein n=1 Tax=Cinara cedri TaxID=506608 RepID=A0A5E4N1Y1_9HEMI|nr:Hypothetical protein CINCED_3A024263 [Cinara cedri]